MEVMVRVIHEVADILWNISYMTWTYELGMVMLVLLKLHLVSSMKETS